MVQIVTRKLLPIPRLAAQIADESISDPAGALRRGLEYMVRRHHAIQGSAYHAIGYQPHGTIKTISFAAAGELTDDVEKLQRIFFCRDNGAERTPWIRNGKNIPLHSRCVVATIDEQLGPDARKLRKCDGIPIDFFPGKRMPYVIGGGCRVPGDPGRVRLIDLYCNAEFRRTCREELHELLQRLTALLTQRPIHWDSVKKLPAPREAQILQLMHEGHCAAAIASIIRMDLPTVRAYIDKIRKLAGAANNIELLAKISGTCRLRSKSIFSLDKKDEEDKKLVERLAEVRARQDPISAKSTDMDVSQTQ